MQTILVLNKLETSCDKFGGLQQMWVRHPLH